MTRIGIRREDKSRWEARAPLVPTDVARYVKENGLEIVVQTSPHRAFKEAEYQALRAEIEHLRTELQAPPSEAGASIGGEGVS